jgi:SAM-dependent methyltransferase
MAEWSMAAVLKTAVPGRVPGVRIPLSPFPWLAALDERHLADLTPSEVTRALRALSSCYVERRGKLASGGALDSAGKRAAFALFYAPLHFFVTQEIVRALPPSRTNVSRVIDLGCGTGAAGAAWALECGCRVAGIDRHPWAVSEARWTYRQLGLRGDVTRGDIARARLDGGPGAGILLAYAVNEVQAGERARLLERLQHAHRGGATVLVIEPIARRLTPWWGEWQAAFEAAGGRADDWRFPADLPPRQRDLGRAAGLNLRELTARTLYWP